MGVVRNPRFFDNPAGKGVAREELLVETFGLDSTSESLDERVVLRFAGQDAMPLDVSVALPLETGVAGHFCAILSEMIIQGRLRLSTRTSSSHATRTPEVELSAIGPSHSLVKSLMTHNMRNWHKRVGAECAFARATPANRQAFCLVEPVELLLIDVDAVARDQDMQTAIGEPAVFAGQFALSGAITESW